jgi:hypothetical protein
MTSVPTPDLDPETVAISAVYTALRNLDPEAQLRVLNYVAMKLNLRAPSGRAEGDLLTPHKEEDSSIPLQLSAQLKSHPSRSCLCQLPGRMTPRQKAGSSPSLRLGSE